MDYQELAQAIQHMTRKQLLYKVLRDELTKLGYWKKLPRGNPKKAYIHMKKKGRLASA